MSIPVDYERALIAPEEVFSSPMDVVTSAQMTAEEKLKILTHWEMNARDLQVATEEGMTGPGRSRYAEVKKALLQLCESENLDQKTANITHDRK